MALQTFTAGQVLTAAQMTALQANDYNQTVSAKVASYVLTAADKGTRITMSSSSATTVTVNTSLFTAGDSLRIQNIGTAACVVTAGTATVTSAGSLSIPQWGGGQLYFTSASAAVYFPDAVTASPSGLVCVKAETAFSGASTITADGIFTSSYTNYMLLITGTCTATNDLTIQLRTGGVTATATNYNYQNYDAQSATINAARITSSGNFRLSSWDTSQNSVQTLMFNPQLAAITQFQSQSVWLQSGSATSPFVRNASGNHSLATSYDGFIITIGGGNMTGNYTVYGYSKTV